MMPIYCANVAQVCRIALSEPVLDIQKQHLCLNWDPGSPRCFAVASNLMPYPTSHGWMMSHHHCKQARTPVFTNLLHLDATRPETIRNMSVFFIFPSSNLTDTEWPAGWIAGSDTQHFENRENSQSVHRICIFAFIWYLGIVHLQVARIVYHTMHHQTSKNIAHLEPARNTTAVCGLVFLCSGDLQLDLLDPLQGATTCRKSKNQLYSSLSIDFKRT